MKTTNKRMRWLILVCGLVAAPAMTEGQAPKLTTKLNAAADQVKLEIDRVEVDDSVYTPYYMVDTEREHERYDEKKWIRLGVEYTTDDGWIDELTIRFIAYSPEISGKKEIYMMRDVTYENVGPGEHLAYVYLHPSYIERYEIGSYDLDMAVKFYTAIGSGVKAKGQLRAESETTKQTEAGWSNKMADKIVLGHLMDRSETPFWYIDYDDHEIIKRPPHLHIAQ